MCVEPGTFRKCESGNYVMFVLCVIALNAAVIWFLLIWPPYDRGKGDD